MNKFFNTAIGKSVQTLLWIVGSFVLTYVAAFITGYHFGASWMAIAAVPIVNWLGYTAKVFAAKEVPNLPSSTPMEVVPIQSPAPPAQVITPTPPTPPAGGMTVGAAVQTGVDTPPAPPVPPIGSTSNS